MLFMTLTEYLKKKFGFFTTYTGNIHLDSQKKTKVWEMHIGKNEKGYILLK